MKRVFCILGGIIYIGTIYCQQANTSDTVKILPDGHVVTDTSIVKQTESSTISLKEVIVTADERRFSLTKSSQNTIQVGKNYIEERFSGSLMQSLEQLPGIKAMHISSGQSKPSIRGLGFNRLVVAENGIKHEGQQWGEDHGLEIDQFAVEQVDIVKGPAAIRYGSDAIGGVINLKNNRIPINRTEGGINLFARSNNMSIGTSVNLQGRSKRFYYKTHLTAIDYADYKVPTDSIQYYSYYIKLKDRRLRNTAGKELNSSIHLGWIETNFHSFLQISSVYAKNGFFADAHGLEVRLSEIDHDRSSRDINLPYHSVNHLKIANHTTWRKGDYLLTSKLAFQLNDRKEMAERVSHGYMPIPPHTTERSFHKNTFTGMVDIARTFNERHELNMGVNGEHQRNHRGGWGFVLPDFRQTTAGIFLSDRFAYSNHLWFTGGIRADFTSIDTEPYNDWYLSPDNQGINVYKERGVELSRTFNSFTWSTGMNYYAGSWSLKLNIGKSFRTPIPKELASDGINYHIFRYEKGNPDLKAEEAYQIDGGINWQQGAWQITLEPFVNYFSNYIYLNPTPDYQEGLQLYSYTQAKVLRWGGETSIRYKFSSRLKASLSGEYLYARQRSGPKKGYTLPFSPPWSSWLETTYTPLTKWSGEDGFITVMLTVVGNQNEIVPPEKQTKGHQDLSVRLGRSFKWNNNSLKINIQGQNLLNKKYYDHTSYYRLIDVPEPGRNLSILVGLNF